MGGTLQIVNVRLRLVALLSSLCAVLAATVAQGHEVEPTIADLTVEGAVLALDLRMNAEAFVAGIDLDGLTDTDDTELSPDYDALRNLAPEVLAERVRAFSDSWLPMLELSADSSPLALSLDTVTVPEVGNPDLARASRLRVVAELPTDARAITVLWPLGAGDLVLRQQGVEAPFTGYLRGGERSPQIPLVGGAETGGWSVFLRYIPVGFDHILPKGLDHILFVLGLFFLSTRFGPLFWQISAFTLAHTVTLALGALGHVTVRPEIVEPLIAASIVFVALENLWTDRLNRWRPMVVFGFGLLHGLGFASVLGEFGLPPGQFVPALIGFNVGVEVGQLTVIALAFLAVGLWFGTRDWYRTRIAMPASVMIACVGAYWFVERVFL
ncbi:MAG: HupE/UreJ family protein [Pseudomonadota bacterium]